MPRIAAFVQHDLVEPGLRLTEVLGGGQGRADRPREAYRIGVGGQQGAVGEVRAGQGVADLGEHHQAVVVAEAGELAAAAIMGRWLWRPPP
ncbi:hypothetical protein C1J01_29450 [Nonomuraea aridisoli]|uniref:Uncharacterized protein n=1 Tax=Nonomuraea aridisoli TaxID=2070368 RepID=A0A2W2DNV3_9ACTN|nr:hypothetical protein [Nonomuraea aridisoli]PZG13606.1 hypothetical protein C1J01_29450 [Nonomuraea aridisoli]